MEIRIENRPLTYHEKTKFHENLREVMNAYEYYTKKKFMRFDVMILEEIIKIATPGQIIAIIKKCSSTSYKDFEKFTYFGYIAPFVKRQFTNRRGGNKHE